MQSFEKNYFYKKYKELDEKFSTILNDSFQYQVNFSEFNKYPIHRWVYYQEGYSPLLVNRILKNMNLDNNSVILDPFVGSGTTVISAKENNINSYGFDVNPYSSFISTIKSRKYSDFEINNFKNFQLPEFKKTQNIYDKYQLKIINNLFDEDQLIKIELIKDKINNIDDLKVKDLLTGNLLFILEKASNYRKGGNGLKKKKNHKKIDVYELFEEKRCEIINDLKYTQVGKEPVIYNDSCLNINHYCLPEIDVCMFSPPYVNCFDPFEVYKIELWLGEFISSYKELKDLRKKNITSNLNANVKQDVTFDKLEILNEIIEYISYQKLWDKRIPKMLELYFYEMDLVLKIIYDNLKESGYCVIVVGNSAYGNLVVPVDLLLSILAEKNGYLIEKIIVARNNETSSQQYNKLHMNIEYMRESILVFKK